MTITDLEDNEPRPKSLTSTPANAAASPAAKPPHFLNPNNPFFKPCFIITLTLSSLIILTTAWPRDPPHPQPCILTLPAHIRDHYPEGRTIEVQLSPNHKPTLVFVLDIHDPPSNGNVLLVPGLGLSSFDYDKMLFCIMMGYNRAVAIDFPGFGFSQKYTVEVENGEGGVLRKLWSVITVIREMGVFKTFAQLMENDIGFEEIWRMAVSRKRVKAVDLGPEEMGKILGKVVDSLEQPVPLHLVLHDTALVMCAKWVLENSKSVRSITLIDTDLRGEQAFPLWVLKMPIIREIFLGSSRLYAMIVKFYCAEVMDSEKLEAQRIFLRHGNGWEAVVGMARKLNHSFDFKQWAKSKELRKISFQVFWSKGGSEDWRNQCKQVSDALPGAEVLSHNSGRWPQKKAVGFLAFNIQNLIYRLRELEKIAKIEPIPKRVIRRFKEEFCENYEQHLHLYLVDKMKTPRPVFRLGCQSGICG